MVRIPAMLVGVVCAVGLGALVFALARVTARPELVTALLPLSALSGGFIAGRWSTDVPVVPGFGVGLLAVAVRIGLALGVGLGLLDFVWPPLALLELISAIVGGMSGLMIARRAAQPAMDIRAGYTTL